MQKWEYCAITGIRYSETNIRPFYPSILNFSENGIQVTSLVGNDEENMVAKSIAGLGEKGWEMIGAGNTSDLTHCIYFKRMKE
jgi:hypothetical protein